jgi:predicted NACHT family NTPase
MDRSVRRIESTSSGAKEDQLRPISFYGDAVNIILLGDPGSGKTHTFRECAARCGGRFVTARAFLVTPASRLGGTLFIDGLDEKRAGRNDRDTVDALVEKLFAVSPTKVRISCRAPDWLGDSDLAALRPYCELSGEPVVLQLDRLSNDEQRVVLQAQGLSTGDANTFLGQARDRGLSDFLENPQNLIMLLDAVQSGKWPASRKELFEISTEIWLQEFDDQHARSGSGVYTPRELRPAAGAICAARLISDVEAVSLTDHEASTAIPSYRSLTMLPREEVMAALGRRVFTAGSVPESVDYVHRTTAEYLGAAWLAGAVRDGMPLTRLQALIGVDAHPAPELRGLHAWLAVHLPEHARGLIDSDPYGVLIYGDAASLPKTMCAQLVKALGKLSQTDPWFRRGKWQSPAIAALSRADMIEEFRAMLRSDDAGFGIRSILVEAAAIGAPMPALKDEFVEVLLRAQSPYAERRYAMIALLRIGRDGEAAAATAFHKLTTDTNALRLKAEIIFRKYGTPFGPEDIAILLNDVAECTGEALTGVLDALAKQIPLRDIPPVLDKLQPAKIDPGRNFRGRWEVARFIESVLIRTWRGIADIEPARALGWLRLRDSYASGLGMGSAALQACVRDQHDLLGAMTDYFLDTLVPDKNSWMQLIGFQRVTLQQVSSEELLDHLTAHLTQTTPGDQKELFLYEAALATAYSVDGVPGYEAFEKLFVLADDRAGLRTVRDASTMCAIPDGYFDRQPRNADGARYDLEEQCRNFANDADAIRNGIHLGWLTWAAQIYFGLFSDVDRTATARERLIAILGETNAAIAIEGFIAALSRNDVPSLANVVALAAQHQHYDWWYALTAGLTERWGTTPSFDGLNDELLKAALAFDLTNPVFEYFEGGSHIVVQPWKAAVLRDRPELARDAYAAIARAQLAKGEYTVHGLHELMVEDALKPYRASVALEFLRDFPKPFPNQLDALFDAVFSIPAAHGGFLALADHLLTSQDAADRPHHDKWLAAAYLLSPVRWEAEVEAAAKLRPAIVFDLRDRAGFDSFGDQQPSVLLLPQIEFLARLTGMHYPETPFPTGAWNGNRNPWDAAEYCRKLIDTISAVHSEPATEALRRLGADANLASYNPHLRHALANQKQRRRESEYDRPDWLGTVKALSNGAPATVADLHALLLDQLNDLGKRIAGENTDIYKSFWNLDKHSRPATPRPEEPCRDMLVTLLRPTLAPKMITVEPEGHMAADKRADISVAMPGRKVLCEWKRDYHAGLWTAADQQLERFYVHDPDAKGFGIYGVLWFGNKRPSPMPKHPDGLEPPKSAAQLEQMLRDRIPRDRRTRIAVLVIDVSGPPSPNGIPSSTSAKKKRIVTKTATTQKGHAAAAGKKVNKKPKARGK